MMDIVIQIAGWYFIITMATVPIIAFILPKYKQNIQDKIIIASWFVPIFWTSGWLWIVQELHDRKFQREERFKDLLK